MSAKIILVIETDLLTRGDGVKTVLRGVKQYWSLDGKLLAEIDPCLNQTKEAKTLYVGDEV